MRSSAYDWPLHTMLNESFWTLLLGNAYILWNSAIVMNPNPENFEVSWFGGYDAWKTKWQPTDGVAVTYNPSDPTHPPFLREGLAPHEGIFPEITLQGETGAWIGAWLYSQISGVSDRVSEFLEYCPFSYVINAGTTQAGYYNGNTPKNGAQGNARLNTATYQNLGQDNIGFNPSYTGYATGSRI